jgi:thiol-disulfide isomerase/thioredoxin
MRQIKIILLVLMLIAAATSVFAANNVKLVVFYGTGCPHCEALFAFLSKIEPEHPTLEVVGYEVYRNSENRQLLSDLLETYGRSFEGVPTSFIAENYTIGYSTALGGEILRQINYCEENNCPDPLARVQASPVINLTKPSVPGQLPDILNIWVIGGIIVAVSLFIFILTRKPKGEHK